MNFFTYNDYNDYLQNYSHSKKFTKEKNNEKSKIEYDIIDKYILKTIDEKEEIIKFLKSFYKKEFQYLKSLYIQKVSYNLEIEESKKTQIYKYITKEIYFIIQYENQFYSKKIFEILKICTEILKEWKQNHLINFQKRDRYPIIIPIIIYTGDKEWISEKNIKLTQTEFKENGVYFSYNLLNIKNISTTQFIEKDILLADLLALKKCDKKDIKKVLKILIKDKKNSREKYILNKINNKI